MIATGDCVDLPPINLSGPRVCPMRTYSGKGQGGEGRRGLITTQFTFQHVQRYPVKGSLFTYEFHLNPDSTEGKLPFPKGKQSITY